MPDERAVADGDLPLSGKPFGRRAVLRVGGCSTSMPATDK
jgi:hypothetical protein